MYPPAGEGPKKVASLQHRRAAAAISPAVRGRPAPSGLAGDQVARIVKRRAALVDLDGEWAAHSLRSGFVTEAGPLGEVKAMTEHSVSTVMGYVQAGSLLSSRASQLLTTSSALEDSTDQAEDS